MASAPSLLPDDQAELDAPVCPNCKRRGVFVETAAGSDRFSCRTAGCSVVIFEFYHPGVIQIHQSENSAKIGAGLISAGLTAGRRASQIKIQRVKKGRTGHHPISGRSHPSVTRIDLNGQY
jgi:hypothetical protein